MLERMRYGIVGAGPCGSITALLLLEAGYEVHLFDIDDTSEALGDNSKSNIKLMDGSTSPYDMNQLLTVSIKSSPASFYRSKLSGGFSNVWGATWGSLVAENNQQLAKHYELVTERVFRSLGISPDDGFTNGCRCMDFLDPTLVKIDFDRNLKFSKTQLAINPSICSCIETGATSCAHGSVWNSKFMLEECMKYKSFSFISGVDITKIENVGDQLSLSYLSTTQFYDGITIAAGPLGSSEILLNTFSGLSSIEVSDTLMGYMPFYKFRLNSRHSGAFAFSQFRFDIIFGTENLSAHTQLYSHSEIYLDRILNKLPKIARPVLKKFAGVILAHIGIALIYLDSKASNSLTISKGRGGRELEINILKPEEGSSGLRRKLWQTFRLLRIFPLVPLISWAKPGESYHLGAGGKDLLDDLGFVKVDTRISVAGALGLTRVDPGPITHASMAQSSRLVEWIVHQNLESN